MIKVENGNPLPVVATLFDGDGSKFLKVHIYNSGLSEVVGSPFNMSNLANGNYLFNSYTPTSNGVYIAKVIVYDDSSYSIKSIDYVEGQDIFYVSNDEAERDQIISDISNAVSSINDNIDTGEGNAI